MSNLYRYLVVMHKQQAGTADLQVQRNFCRYCLLHVIQKANSDPLGVERLPDVTDNPHVKVARLSALHTGRLYPRIYPWYSFLLEAESTPRP